MRRVELSCHGQWTWRGDRCLSISKSLSGPALLGLKRSPANGRRLGGLSLDSVKRQAHPRVPTGDFKESGIATMELSYSNLTLPPCLLPTARSSSSELESLVFPLRFISSAEVG